VKDLDARCRGKKSRPFNPGGGGIRKAAQVKVSLAQKNAIKWRCPHPVFKASRNGIGTVRKKKKKTPPGKETKECKKKPQANIAKSDSKV